MCNIFYIVNNVNFIDYSNNCIDIEEEYTNMLITNKINGIKTIEDKLINVIANKINVLDLNNDILGLRNNMEKTIDSLYNEKSYINNYNSNMLNNIYIILNNIK